MSKYGIINYYKSRRADVKNLMEEIDVRLQEFGLSPISDIVNNKEKSISYINRVLKEYGNKVAIPFQLTLDKYDFRVKHVLFSFGLGIVLASFCYLKEKIEQEYEKYKIKNTFIYTWLTLCLYHDFGYFIGSSYLRTDNIKDLLLDHYIFDYSYCKSRYTQNLYFEYYKRKYASQNWDEKDFDMVNNEEVGDHGILGGYVLFALLYSSETKKALPKKAGIAKVLSELENGEKNIEYHSERIPLYQDICFRIMEHNIWKNEEALEKTHPLYEIDANNFVNIDIVEPLLFLLSLVDTIEMTKRFCTYIDSSSDKERFVYPKTLGSKIQISVTPKSIEIDYSDLETYIKEHKYVGDIQRWTRSVTGLIDWVSLDVLENANSQIVVKKAFKANI